MKLKIKKLHPDAVVPKFAHADDAGMDLYSVDNHILKPGQITKIPTGISTEFSKAYVGLIWDRSSLGINNGLKTLGGVLDAGYRGELIVGLINLSKKTYRITKGDKVAQILFKKIERPEIVLAGDLTVSKRGKGGLGSTGKK